MTISTIKAYRDKKKQALYPYRLTTNTKYSKERRVNNHKGSRKKIHNWQKPLQHMVLEQLNDGNVFEKKSTNVSKETL